MENLQNQELFNYVNENVIAKYKNFDGGHDERHAEAVINRSFDIAEQINADVDINMVFVVAAYHDIGMLVSRENHATHSKEIMLFDVNLKRWFSPEQISVMADAVEDHSTSSKREPRSIYGKIVSDADKDLDISVGILRGWDYLHKNKPNLTFEECIDNMYDEMRRRFCKNADGERLVKFYFETPAQKQFVEKMEYYATHKDKLAEIVKSLTGNGEPEKSPSEKNS